MEPRSPLLAALAVAPGAVVAIAGGGGKTSLMFALARALRALGQRVITTTTTRIYPPGHDDSPGLVLLETEPDPLAAVRGPLAAAGHVTVAQRLNPDGKLAGIPPGVVDGLAAARLADVIVVEADGSAGRPLKAARDGEPVFPRSSTACVLVVGVDGLGAPLDEAHVFRSALAAEVTGLAPGAPVTAEAVVALLVGPRGLASRAPERSSLAVLVNKVESAAQEASAYDLARALLARGRVRVVVGSLRRAEAGFAVLER